jgi:hypothetical protein
MNRIVKKKNVEGREVTRGHLLSDQTLPDVRCADSSVQLVTCSASLRLRAFLLHEKKYADSASTYWRSERTETLSRATYRRLQHFRSPRHEKENQTDAAAFSDGHCRFSHDCSVSHSGAIAADVFGLEVPLGSLRTTMPCGGHRRVKPPVQNDFLGCALRCAVRAQVPTWVRTPSSRWCQCSGRPSGSDATPD